MRSINHCIVIFTSGIQKRWHQYKYWRFKITEHYQKCSPFEMRSKYFCYCLPWICIICNWIVEKKKNYKFLICNETNKWTQHITAAIYDNNYIKYFLFYSFCIAPTHAHIRTQLHVVCSGCLGKRNRQKKKMPRSDTDTESERKIKKTTHTNKCNWCGCGWWTCFIPHKIHAYFIKHVVIIVRFVNGSSANIKNR